MEVLSPKFPEISHDTLLCSITLNPAWLLPLMEFYEILRYFKIT